MLENWNRQNASIMPHVVKPIEPPRQRESLTLFTEYIEGQSLQQWMIDQPKKPTLEQIRDITRKIFAQAVSGFQSRSYDSSRQFACKHHDRTKHNIVKIDRLWFQLTFAGVNQHPNDERSLTRYHGANFAQNTPGHAGHRSGFWNI